MSDFASFISRISDVGATVLVVGAAIYFGFRFLPSQAKQQGTTDEILRSATRAIDNNTEALRAVTARDAETRQSLNRIEKRVDDISIDVHDIKLKQQQIQQFQTRRD